MLLGSAFTVLFETDCSLEFCFWAACSQPTLLLSLGFAFHISHEPRVESVRLHAAFGNLTTRIAYLCGQVSNARGGEAYQHFPDPGGPSPVLAKGLLPLTSAGLFHHCLGLQFSFAASWGKRIYILRVLVLPQTT